MRRLAGLVGIMTLFIALFSVSIFAPTEEAFSSNAYCLESAGYDVSSGSTITLTESLVCSQAIELEFDDVVLDCSGYQISGILGDILTLTGEDITIRNCVLVGGDRAIYVLSDGSILENNQFLNQDSNGIYLNSVGGSNIQGGSIENSGDSSLYVDSSDEVVVNDLSFVGPSDYGVEVRSSDSFSLSDSTFSDFSQASISLWSLGDALISGNDFSNTRYGIQMNYVENSEIFENNLVGVSYRAIYDRFGEGNSIYSNAISDSSEAYGLMTVESSDVLLRDNDVDGLGVGLAILLSEVNSENNHFCNSGVYDVQCSGDVVSGSSSEGDFFDTVSTCTVPAQVLDPGAIFDAGDSDGETYEMQEDLDCSSHTDPICLEIDADDFTLDCNGFSIFGADIASSVGIAVYGENVEVRNCVVRDFHSGIRINTDAASLTVENSYVTLNRIGVVHSGGDLTVSDSFIYRNDNYGVLVNSGGTTRNLVLEDNFICRNPLGTSSSYYDLYCTVSLDSLTATGNELDDVSCGGYLPSKNDGCPLVRDYQVTLPTGTYEAETFPSPSYSCFENSRSTCSDGVDNDGDGLIDCQEESCQAQLCSTEFNDYACIDYQCVEVFVPEATQATVAVEETFDFLFTYQDFFTWLENAEVHLASSSEGVICDELCVNQGKECLFAEAGRSTCSMQGSHKCTCA